jgi:hypothetical protein
VNNQHVIRSITSRTMSCHPHLNVTGASVKYQIVQTYFVLHSPRTNFLLILDTPNLLASLRRMALVTFIFLPNGKLFLPQVSRKEGGSAPGAIRNNSVVQYCIIVHMLLLTLYNCYSHVRCLQFISVLL